MSKFKVTLCALAISMVSAYAGAEITLPPGQGTVTFTGELTDETCTVDPTSKDIKVVLPTIGTETLAAAGAQGGSTTFPIKVTDCPVGVTEIAAHFEAIDQTKYNPATGNLINQDPAPDAATNVEVRLFETDGTVLPVGSTGSSFPVDETTNTGTMTYMGAYYATGATTVGTVTAVVQYTLAYP
ncbi:fimbrial protein [Buttiauxella agrestis]|uniref:fimbrial protein n=1 Tax=Buttiauxella agrestis TaxID=82977 RepID=UPI0039772285